MNSLQILEEKIKSLVTIAFENAWNNKENTDTNSKRSAFFVSELSFIFKHEFGGEVLVQSTDTKGVKFSGEWLLDIALVSKDKIRTDYKNREGSIVNKIHWAVESEFSTNISEFCKDFSKLLHIKSERYLYISGLNQVSALSRLSFIEAQIRLSRSLVSQHHIKEPFFLVFLPTPGRSSGCKYKSVWDGFEIDDLISWIKIVELSGSSVDN